MNDGIKITTRQETFNDRAIDELAEVKAACLCRLQYKRCLEYECSGCSHGRNYDDTVKHMNSYEKSRLMQRTSEAYGRLSLYPEAFMLYKRIRNRYAAVFIFLFLCIVGLVYICNLLYSDNFSYGRANTAPTYRYANTAPEGSEETADSMEYISTYDAVREIQAETKRIVCDINQDGLVNCIDYALTFKLVWDYRYLSCNCRIVRNYHPGVLNHLFVLIYNTSTEYWYAIEPYAVDNRVEMYEYWGAKYDPAYNRYDEEDFWIHKIVNQPNWDKM